MIYPLLLSLFSSFHSCLFYFISFFLSFRDYGAIKPGSTVFINGGASSTGQAAIQLAKNHFGKKEKN